MDSNCLFRLLFLGMLALPLGSAARLTAAEERTRCFPDQKFQYTLPGGDWGWEDEKKVRGSLFVAKKGESIAICILAVKVPEPRVQKDFEDYVEGAEETFYQKTGFTKRAGRFMTFRQLPTDQLAYTRDDGRSGVSRLFIAHGLGYHLLVVGGLDPVEDTPGFESFMNGFEFTVPPNQELNGDRSWTPQANGQGELGQKKSETVAYRMGRESVPYVIGVVGLLVVLWASLRRKATNPRGPRDSGAPERLDTRDESTE